MEFAHESFTNVKNEIKPLIEQHYQEIALHKDSIRLNPDWKGYARLADQGALRVYTAREDGELVGYFVIIVNRSLHYMDHLFANNDIIFIKKGHRKGTAGIKLIKYAVEELKAEGVTLININSKIHQSFGPVLERMDFAHIENVYSIKVN
jgi:GNAT superfamily N-acetyltransferase